MTLTRTSPAAVAAYALSLAGRSRDHLPVPWTASKVMDDCAAFCSHVLWGGKPGPILWVDNFKTAGDGSYAAGSRDLQPWDVLLFDWEGNGIGNHVEFYVRDLGGGYVQTYGANGSDSREARYRNRPRRYIMGRFRAAWGGAPLVSHLTPTTTSHPTVQEDTDMPTPIAFTPSNRWFDAAPGHFASIPSGQGDSYLASSGRDRPCIAQDKELDVIRDRFLRMQPTQYVAVTDGPNKDQWFVVGPDVFYRVKPGEDFSSRYGSVRRIGNEQFVQLRADMRKLHTVGV